MVALRVNVAVREILLHDFFGGRMLFGQQVHAETPVFEILMGIRNKDEVCEKNLKDLFYRKLFFLDY